MANGEPPRVPYSHDRNLTLLGHEALELGYDVYVSSGVHGIFRNDLRHVSMVAPHWAYEDARADASSFDCVVSAGIEQLHVRDLFTNAKIVGVLPALHMFESPSFHGPAYVYNFVKALREHVDFAITLNARMAETLSILSVWLARFDLGERLIIAPLGFSEDQLPPVGVRTELRNDGRSSMNLSQNDVLFINAGGAWGWTDTDTFIDAMCRYSVFKEHNMRVYFSGITQPDNPDRNDVAVNIQKLQTDYPQLFKSSLADEGIIYIERDWAKGGKDVNRLLYAADIGIHLNKASFEAWQSHRVRFIDYLSAGLPILSTGGDSTSAANAEACLFCNSGDINSYLSVFEQITSQPDLLAEKRKAASQRRKQYDSALVHRAAWRQIEQTPRRERGSSTLEPSFLDVLMQEYEAAIKRALSERVDVLLKDLDRSAI
jgi:hypothetical protein